MNIIYVMTTIIAFRFRTYFGFLLGLLQMTQLMLFPANWTLPVSGAIVGFLTNWIALQLIFKPIEPYQLKLNDYTVTTIQGFCLARQKEVSLTFSEFIAKNVLTSEVRYLFQK